MASPHRGRQWACTPWLPFQGPIPPIRGKCPEGTKGVGMLSPKVTARSSPVFEYFRRCAFLGSPSRGAGSAQPRLRGCIDFATAGCLRRPYLFPCAGKDRGEKGAGLRFWCILPLDSGKPLVFRYRSTRYSPYRRHTTRRLIRGRQVCN